MYFQNELLQGVACNNPVKAANIFPYLRNIVLAFLHYTSRMNYEQFEYQGKPVFKLSFPLFLKRIT